MSFFLALVPRGAPRPFLTPAGLGASTKQVQSTIDSMKFFSQRQDFGYSRTVSYTNRDHLSVITQRWGSVHRKVLPFCATNTLLGIFLVWLLEHGVDLSISEFGHEFMSILVAFLVINKLSFTLGLYYELQGHLASMNQAAIELTQLAYSFTKRQAQPETKEWRFNVTLQVLSLLKATIDMIYKGGQENVWEAPFLQDQPVKLFVDNETSKGHVPKSFLSAPAERYIAGLHLKSDKNLRVPIRIAQRLRDEILSHQNLPVDPMDTIQERMLLDQVQQFMASYHGIRKYLTCPLPLPLVQLGRIFVMFYVYTLPFALLSPELNLNYLQMIVLIAIMTYGFMGIELLFVEIDDPFAEDPNDLPLMEEARATGEDIILSMMVHDGRETVERLWKRLSPDGKPLANPYQQELFTYGAATKETDSLV